MLKSFISILLIAFQLVAVANDFTDSLETLYPHSRGQERLDIYLKLAEEYLTKNTHQSIHFSELAIALSDSLDNKTALARAYKNLSIGQKTLGLYDDALKNVALAKQLFQQADRIEDYIQAINIEGTIHLWRKDLDVADELFRKALKELFILQGQQPESDTLRKTEIAFRNNIGLVFLMKEEFDLARSYYESLLKDIDTSDYQNLKLMLANLGYIYLKTAEYDKALENALHTVSLSRRLQNQQDEAIALLSLGNINYYKGDHDTALDYYEQAYRLNLEVGDKSSAAMCANNIASVYENKGNYELAVTFFQNSLRIKEELDDKRGMATTLGNIGIVYQAWEDYKNARLYFDRALLISRQTGFKEGIAQQCNNIASIMAITEKADSALLYFQTALAYADTINNRRLKVNVLIGLGSLYANVHQKHQLAITYYKTADKLAAEIQSSSLEARCHVNMGESYYNLKSYDIALAHLRSAYQYAEESGAHDILSNALLYLSKVYEAIGNDRESLAYYKRYTEVKDSIFSKEKAQIVSDLQTKYETEKKENENLILKNNNQVQQLQLSRKDIQIKFMVYGILSSLILFSVIIYLYRKRTLAYRRLVEKNLELARHDRESLDRPGEGDPGFMPDRSEQSHEQQFNLELARKFTSYLAEEKPYLDPSLTMEEVCSRIGTNRTYLSQALKVVYNSNFTSIINEQRIRLARQMLADPKFDNISIEGIGKMVGYNTRAAFHLNFKRITGLTPSYFKASIRR